MSNRTREYKKDSEVLKQEIAELEVKCGYFEDRIKKLEYRKLTSLLNEFFKFDIPIFPIQCPVCDSLKMTAVHATKRNIECLSCSSRFYLQQIEESKKQRGINNG